MGNKICGKHGVLSQEDMYVRKNRNTIECMKCVKEYRNKNYQKNREKRLLDAAAYREANRERINEWARNDRKVNKKKYADKELENRLDRHSKRVLGEIKRRFGLSADEYHKMIDTQKNLCAICGKPESRKARGNDYKCSLCIDHCHSTGKVRGLLCHSCNTGIGKFHDDVELLKKAINYLEKHK